MLLINRRTKVLAPQVPLALLGLALITPTAQLQAQATQESIQESPKKQENIEEEPTQQQTFKEIRVEKADIASFIRIFSKETKRNYILDEKVRGTVTGYFPGGLSQESQERILDSILALKGFTTVPIAKNLWKVVPSKEALKSTVPFRDSEDDSPLTGSVVTSLLALKHVAASDLQAIVTQMISPDGLVQAYPASNSLLIVDYDLSIKRIEDLVQKLDIPYADREMTIIPVEYADATDLAEKLQTVLGEDNSDQSGPGNMGAIQRRITNQGTRIGGENQPLGAEQRREPKIIADERTNSIIVVADLETTARIRALIAQLDSELDRGGFKFYVYRCQHANANALAEVLGGLVGASATGGGAGNIGGANQAGLNTPLNRSQQRANRSQNRLSQQRRTPGSSLNQNPTSPGAASVQFDDSTSITADPDTNSLIISSSRETYEKILGLLRDLDIKRRQVLVEAVILEVSIDEATQTGTDWLTSTGGADGGVLAQSNFGGANGLQGLISNPAGLNNFTIAAASAGLLKLPGDIAIPNQSIIMNAAQNNSKVNVLSAPTLLATDNQQAEIIVGQNVPFLASTSTNDVNLNNTFNQIDRQDVGITLRITPQINSNNFVNLNIFTDVSAVIPSADSTLGPTTTVRSSETTVIVKDSQMIAIGGLISDENSDSTSGVPFFRNLPVLGDLFGRGSETRRRTNLLTFITPHIIRDQFDARDETLEKRDRLRQEIETNDVPPRRRDILENPSIDNVAELSRSALPIPEPLLPENPIRHVQTQAQFSQEQVEEGSPLEIDVEATLPNDLRPKYLLLKVDASKALQPHLPFTLNADQQVLLNSADPLSQRFFKVGHSYAYAVGDEQAQIIVEAALKSAKTTSEQQKWAVYTPSPYELLNLGKGPWTRKQ